jgi:hypothetical protein
MRKLKNLILIQCLRMIDWILDVNRDKPVYLVFFGEGQVEIQESGQPSKIHQL